MLIAITGGFGSGKSLVLSIFRSLGAEVVDADSLVHQALERDDLKRALTRVLGQEILTDGRIDRKKVAEKVFKSPEIRKEVEKLIHPLVFKGIDETVRNSKGKVVAAEIPLLFETGYEREVDQVITVSAPEDQVMKRLREKGFSDEEIRLRRAAQLPETMKILRADYHIDNSGTPADTERQVRKIWEEISRR